MEKELKQAFDALEKHIELGTHDLSRDNRIHAQVAFSYALKKHGLKDKLIDWSCSDCVRTSLRSVFNLYHEENRKTVEAVELKETDVVNMNLEEMHISLLKKIAKDLGIKFGGNISKPKLIKLIEDAGK